jgi:hypothetical protein
MYIYNVVSYINLMKILMILTLPLILSMSIMLGLGSADMGAFGQTNQTSAPPANQTSAPPANQTSAPPANQTSAQANQTSGPQMTDKLLSLANDAQRALNEGNETAVAESVGQLQGTLINASEAEGKQVVIVPSDVISPNAEDTPADTPLDEEED